MFDGSTQISADREPLTILIPVYNEELILAANVARLRDYLRGRAFSYEIILISNGSTDSTVQIAKECVRRFPDVRLITLPRRGVGLAFKEGVRHARHQCLVSLDLDLTTDLELIDSAAALLGKAHLVIGSKQAGSQQRSWVRRLASAAFIRSVHTLLGLKFTDYSIGAKAYRKSVIEPYLPHLADGSTYVLQLIAWGTWDGSAIAEIPVWCEDYRKSKFNLLYEGVYRFGSLFLLWFQKWGRKRLTLGPIHNEP